MRSQIGKNRDFGVHFGANLRLKTSSFWAFSKCSTFIFNKILASLVSKNNLFSFSPAYPFRQTLQLRPARRFVRTPGSERQTYIGYHRRVGMSSGKCRCRVPSVGFQVVGVR
jgi:hypothetical protein